MAETDEQFYDDEPEELNEPDQQLQKAARLREVKRETPKASNEGKSLRQELAQKRIEAKAKEKVAGKGAKDIAGKLLKTEGVGIIKYAGFALSCLGLLIAILIGIAVMMMLFDIVLGIFG
jgi:hypothetical protein